MKHFSPGLSDSIASVIADPTLCPYCDSSSRLGGGLCVGCLLQSGLDPNDGCAPEALLSALAEISLPDKNWRLGNYEILEEIGRGGMGVIYRARQRHSRRIVAVKRVLGYHADSRETLARFRREAQAAASLDHPNILPIYEVSESEDGLPFFSMKFAPGGSLQEVGPALRNDPRHCVAVVAKIARAVQHAHGKGILHRDLKPGNILLDAHGEPLVSDFGLAKWLDTTSDLTRTLTIFGTPGYIAPEQASGPAEQLKPAADVYSLGAILFDLLAGRPPFLGSHALSVIRQASETSAPKLRTLSKVADRDLETICARCLERDPSARYPSAHDLADDLERWLEGRPIIARPVSAPTRAYRWCRRNPAMSVATVTGMAGILFAIGYEFRSRHFESVLRRDALMRHSVTVLPFLDLDEGRPDNSLAEATRDALHNAMIQLGPAKVTSLSDLPTQWTGTGNVGEVRAAVESHQTRSVLCGTRRRIAGATQLSLRLMDSESNEVLGSWIFDQSDQQTVSANIAAQGLPPAVYRILDGQKHGRTPVKIDLGMENERARPYLIKGQELLYRRTILDMDRAIACFQGAVEAEPRSITAHCYLALASMGRDYLSTTPELAERALEAINTALTLGPSDPTAHRSACAVLTSIGNYPEALEHGFQALEFGDQSERTSGQIGFIWKMIGRPDLALRWLQKARVTHPQPADCDALVGDCWADLLQDERARSAYESAASFQPDQADGWIGLCRLKLLVSDFEGARQIYLRELPKYPQSQNGRRMAALVEFLARNVPEAEKRYRELMQDDPFGGIKGGFYNTVDYRSALACLHLMSGNAKEARAIILDCLAAEEKRIARFPTDPLAHYRKAGFHAMLGESAEALTELRAAVNSGWIDFRATRIDPRFDHIAQTPEFASILGEAANKAQALAQKGVGISLAQNPR